jgi:glycerophosphoryl diester phosphodiesterase
VANSALIEEAKRRALLVHTWTFRNKPHHLARTYGGDPQKEYLQFFELGVDGVFSEFPDAAVAAREIYLKNQ